MAKAHSQDSRAEDGGEWPWMERAQVKKLIADAALATGKGGLSELIEDETVFIILKVDDMQMGKPEAVEKVRSQIEESIQKGRSQAALNAWLQDARRKAVIKRMD